VLPRSSIAAVLARGAEIGLSPDQIRELGHRDAALQKQFADLREQFAPSATPARRQTNGEAGSPAGRSPASTTIPDAPGGSPLGGHGHRGGGWHRSDRGDTGARSVDPATRASELQGKMNDADTAAWFSAEAVLTEAQREPARAVAARYREMLADAREAAAKSRR
jgi:hypothetical protein